MFIVRLIFRGWSMKTHALLDLVKVLVGAGELKEKWRFWLKFLEVKSRWLNDFRLIYQLSVSRIMTYLSFSLSKLVVSAIPDSENCLAVWTISRCSTQMHICVPPCLYVCMIYFSNACQRSQRSRWALQLSMSYKSTINVS